MIRDQVKGLEHFETVHGGWFYYASGFQRPLAPSASFVNAAVLVALARAAGSRHHHGPPTCSNRAIQATADQRKPDSSYLYSVSSPLDKSAADEPINRPGGQPGPLAGLQPGPAALGRPKDHRPGADGLARSPDHPQRLARHGPEAADPPRVATPMVAGYFYYFGHYYAALCIAQLPESDRPFYQDHLARILLSASRKRRLLVGLSPLQLPPAVRHRLRPPVAGMLPKARPGTIRGPSVRGRGPYNY